MIGALTLKEALTSSNVCILGLIIVQKEIPLRFYMKKTEGTGDIQKGCLVSYNEMVRDLNFTSGSCRETFSEKITYGIVLELFYDIKVDKEKDYFCSKAIVFFEHSRVLLPLRSLTFIRELTIEELLTHKNSKIRELGLERMKNEV